MRNETKYMVKEVDDLSDEGRDEYFKIIYRLMAINKEIPYLHGLSTNVEWLQFVDQQGKSK